MVDIYHDVSCDLHSANGKRWAQLWTPLFSQTLPPVRTTPYTLLATQSQIEAAFDKLSHVNQGPTPLQCPPHAPPCGKPPNAASLMNPSRSCARSPMAVNDILA